MSLKKPISILAILIICALTTAAQEGKCAVKLAQLKAAPELYGLRLGMTFDQVRAVVPAIQASRTDELGLTRTSFSPDFNPQISKGSFAGARTVSLEFLDDKLFMLWIGFNDTYKWKTLEEFVPGMSNALGLPAGAWSMKGAKQILECDDFQATAQMIGQGPSIRLTDKAARELWQQRRTELEEKRSEQETDEPR